MPNDDMQNENTHCENIRDIFFNKTVIIYQRIDSHMIFHACKKMEHNQSIIFLLQ